MKNPFPGMNPWLQDYWRDVHASLLVYARNALNGALPAGLRARVDERLEVESAVTDEPGRAYLPDVAVTADWDRSAFPATAATLEVARPVIVTVTRKVARRLEIVKSDEHIVTVLEVLSPSNRRGAYAVEAWCRKRDDYLDAGFHAVEVDLIRAGVWVLPGDCPPRRVPETSVAYHVCVTRQPFTQQHEFYVAPLRERLPVIRVPLRRGDPDIALDLQALIDQCYADGRYGEFLRYDQPPHPPLPEAEAAWAREILARAPGA